MIYIDLPTGDGWGWGICGDSLAQALSIRRSVERVPRVRNHYRMLPGPLLQSVDEHLLPKQPGLLPTRRVGYTFFEEDVAIRRAARFAPRAFDVIATGCRWCEEVLREAGLTHVTTIHQGIDGGRFNPMRATWPARVNERNDRFVVFSGGKFELRKGQDIVVRAFRAFSQRHDDVYLLAAWHNPFSWTSATMSASPYHPFVPSPGEPFQDAIMRWLVTTGVDMRRVELVPRVPNAGLAAIYGRSTVGLFPNRCEGGTNLVLMEFMACGRAAIATDFSGHRDVLNASNSIRLHNQRLLPIKRVGSQVAVWCEPDLEEIIETLETAYQQPHRLVGIGQQAAVELSEWTWHRTADRFLSVLDNNA